ncbi:MAG: NAD+ synthase [Planctomycetota bacterium]|nr:MAG: NAD+ synthase [Planctomycetota bacterium]
MRFAIGQVNPTIGDLHGNCQLIEQAHRGAAENGAQLLVLPELAVCGYPPKDLLLRDGFIPRCEAAVERLAQLTLGKTAILVGHPSTGENGAHHNSASLLADGKVVDRVHKTLLPNYDVFDERRYFRPQRPERLRPIEFMGRKLGVHICEDAWWGQPETFYHIPEEKFIDPVRELARQGAEILINLSASPFEVDKAARRRNLIAAHVLQTGLPFVFVNQIGGHDDLVFDGHSFVMDSRGQVRHQSAGFRTDLDIVDLDQLPPVLDPRDPPREYQLLEALTLGLRDYMRRCGFTDCVLGLSGGIDSAVACYIAARAVGPENVHGILMPSRYSSQHSIDDAWALVKALGVDGQLVSIDDTHKSYEAMPVIGQDLASQPGGLADQNLQARIRGAIVMTRSNRRGWIALATGNKSELAVGYCTLYGDMCGGFAMLSDLYKRDVYALARYINSTVEKREVIPHSTIEKAPSAELAPNQFDQDTLPAYPILDGILEGLVDHEDSIEDLAKQFSIEQVRWVATRLDRNEFKRRQMAPGVKLSPRAFGFGRRMPMAMKLEY